MKQINIPLNYFEFESIEELQTSDRLLLEKAVDAIGSAYAPYSQYYVGAAVKLVNGMVITGNNQENVAYPSGLCAERIALFSAASAYPGIAVETLAVAGKALHFRIINPVTPCGACRQVIAEYEDLHRKPIRIIMKGESDKIWVVESISHLLPLMFTAEELKKTMR